MAFIYGSWAEVKSFLLQAGESPVWLWGGSIIPWSRRWVSGSAVASVASYAMVVDTLAKAVAGKRYIAGKSFTAADIYVGAHIGWGLQFGTLDKRPEFNAYREGLKDRAANLRSDEQAWRLLP